MPFTPFHFGIALPFVFLDWKKKRIDIITALLATVIVDSRSTILFLFFGVRDMATLHGIFHNFLMATILGLLLAIFVHFTSKYWNFFLKFVKWDQSTSLGSKMVVGVLFANSHVILDAALYGVMNPFWPFSEGNPLFGWLSYGNVITICIYGYILGGLLFIASVLYLSLNPPNQEEKSDLHSSE